MSARTITVTVRPNARRARVEDLGEGEYRVHVDAPAVRGKANERLLEILSAHLGCKRWQLDIVRGSRGHTKHVQMTL